MPPRKRKRQTRLTFEAGAAPPSPDQNGPSTSRVRYTTVPAPPARASPLKPVSLPRRDGGQTVIGESSNGMASGNQRSRASASFMPRLSQRPKVPAVESSDEEAAGEGAIERNDSSDDEDTLPPFADLAALKSSQSVSSHPGQTVLSDDDDDGHEDDEDEVPVPSSARRRKPPVLQLDSDSDDDLVVLSPAKRQRTNRPKARAGSSASDSEEQPLRSPPKSARRLRAGKAGQQAPSSPSKRHQGHRTEKQKKMELLRRRRAGEKIDRLTSSESEDDGDRRGLYDTDSDEELLALKEFDDDDEEEEEEEEEEAEAAPPASKKAKKAQKAAKKEKKKKKKAKKAQKARGGESGEEKDSDLDSFIDSDDDGPLGAPDVAIPLEFTAQAHKPLKEQFPYVVEWLVHNRLDPAFARDDAVYRNAWRKLNDEYTGLASSKFSSAAWRADFARTLRARPKIDAYEMDAGDDGRFRCCEACGRSGHPATWRLVFQGAPYSKETLQEIEKDSSASDSDDDNASVDSHGNTLPAASKEWVVGSTCKSNAETAHVLLHWKHALQEWVEDRLEQDGWMTPARIAERERLKPRKRRKLADAVVDQLRADHVIAALFADFKANLEEARNKTTRGNGRWQ